MEILTQAKANPEEYENAMVDLKKAYINQAILLSQHVMDDRVRFRQEEAEKAFGSVLNVQSHQTNLPDDFDPNAPRFVFQSSGKQLLLSKVAVQAVFGFEDSAKSLKEQMSIIQKNFAKVSERIPQFQTPTGEVGFVLNINIPSLEDRVTLSDAVFNRYLKIPKIHKVASTSFKVGFETEDCLFVNFEVDVYELKRLEMQLGVFPQAIDFSKLPINQMGYGIKVDINNKPRMGNFKDYSIEQQEVFVAMVDFIDNQLPRLVSL